MNKNTIRILYVDDENPNLINFKFLFQNHFEIHTALSTSEGFELLKLQEFQIIVSDQRMPDMTGINFLAEVSKLYPETIRILLTAYTETQNIIDAINIGQVYQYITKPYQKQAMMKVLEKAAEIWILRKQNSELIFELKQSNEEYESINEELRQLIEELIITKDKAEESDRLKTAFLQNISHEIRTPMNAIVGFSDILDNPDLTEEKRKSYITIIQNSSHQLLSIVNDVLTISSLETKQEKVDIQKTYINSILSDLFEIFQNQIKNKNLSIYFKPGLENTKSIIFTDSTKFTQIITNLLTNAIKFTNSGYVEYGYSLLEDRDEKMLQFYVKDTGIGIRREMHERIFDRFRQAIEAKDKKYGGTGLGLAIAKAFVKILGGKIWVESEPEKGSIFYFTIPYELSHDIDEIIESDAKYGNKTTILVVEDEEYNYLYIKEVLSQMNFKIIHAKDGREAIDLCKTTKEIGLVLMDIKLPLMDGQEAAKKIKEFLPGLPIIAQSAYALEKEREKYSGAEFVDYITKPIKKTELKDKVIKYLKKNI